MSATGAKTFSPKDPSGGSHGTSMINPHNPEFLVKKPWYLGGEGSSGPTLDHQTDQRPDTERVPLSLQVSEHLLSLQREKIARDRSAQKFQVGMWVEALRRNKPPYAICQIIKIAGNGTLFDLRYDDGTVEKSIQMPREDRGTSHARIRITGAGSRALESIPNAAIPVAASFGKETFDSKRDRYHGFDTGTSYMQRMEQKFGAREALRRQIRSQLKTQDKDDNTNNESQRESKKKGSQSDTDSDYDSDQGSSDSDEEFVQRDQDAKVHTSRIARQGGVGGQEMKITARNLRIREDTAKYLRNLDPNSAFYDPKSRSMRDNPNPNMDPTDLPFAGDNFARISGDAVQLAKTQVFAWDLAEKVDIATDDTLAVVHPQANPSQAELLRKKHEHIQADTKKQKRQVILSKYGGGQYFDDGTEKPLLGVSGGDEKIGMLRDPSMDASLQLDTETMEERKTRFGVILSEELYSRDGKIIRHGIGTAATATQPKYTKLKSKYEEDIFINGHTTIFGSYFHRGAFRWGYADDHSLIRNSYCTGSNGKIANDEANEWKYGTGIAGSAALAQARELLKATGAPLSESHEPYASLGSSSLYIEVDPAKLRAELRKQRFEDDKEERVNDKKRGYNSLSNN